MIYLISKTIYNGDALARLKLQPGHPIHEYFTIGMRASVDVADIIREYNITRVTVLGNIIVVSANAQEWRWFVRELKESEDSIAVALAENIVAALPDVFRDNPGTTALARR